MNINSELTVTELTGGRWNFEVPHTQVTEDGIVFSAIAPDGQPASLILYSKKSGRKIREIPFPEKRYSGQVAAMKISGIRPEQIAYTFRIGEEEVIDPWSQILVGSGGYGKEKNVPVRGAFISGDFQWDGNETCPSIPYRDSIFYELNIRSFTRGRASGVSAKGTFRGAAEKIPYLKELGITAVVLMPCYEFDEVLPGERKKGGLIRLADSGTFVSPASLSGTRKVEEAKRPEAAAADEKKAQVRPPKEKKASRRVNLWGFGPGYFYAPKRGYSKSGDPYREFCAMVESFHLAGLEVIMEMDFSGLCDCAQLLSVLLWWRRVYHVDGFVLFGDQADLNAVCKSPALADVKLISDYFPAEVMYRKGSRAPAFKNLAECNRGFLQDARRLLKSDEGALLSFIGRSRYNPDKTAVVNFIADHNGFTLMDLVSYNESHNGESGEVVSGAGAGQLSWNCGAEGSSRKKEITRLRMRQIRNAFAMLLLSQGTPMILQGDELGNSQKGDSNAWCYDSELTWIDWTVSPLSRSIFDYVRSLIRYRKEHPELHQEKEPSAAAVGNFFPPFSVHGENAWVVPRSSWDRSAGLMFCGKDTYIYAAYNFYWEKKNLALPILPDGRVWKVVMSTSDEQAEVGKTVRLPARSCVILEG